MSRPSRLWPFVAAIVLLIFINLPLAHLKWTDHRLDVDGVSGVGHVTEIKAFGGKNFITFRLPASIDARQHTYTVEVPADTFARAEQTQELAVSYLPQKPSTNRAVAEVPAGTVAIWLTVMANLTVFVMLGLMFWSRRHGMLVLDATEDVSRCKPDDTVLEVGGGLFIIRGDVLEIHDDHIVIQANSDKVQVFLGEHHNPVGHQQPAQVHGRRHRNA